MASTWDQTRSAPPLSEIIWWKRGWAEGVPMRVSVELGAGGLPANCDAGGVAAEGSDVVLDPFERGDEVAQSVVGGAVVFGAEERAEIEEAEDA